MDIPKTQTNNITSAPQASVQAQAAPNQMADQVHLAVLFQGVAEAMAPANALGNQIEDPQEEQKDPLLVESEKQALDEQLRFIQSKFDEVNKQLDQIKKGTNSGF